MCELLDDAWYRRLNAYCIIWPHSEMCLCSVGLLFFFLILWRSYLLFCTQIAYTSVSSSSTFCCRPLAEFRLCCFRGSKASTTICSVPLISALQNGHPCGRETKNKMWVEILCGIWAAHSEINAETIGHCNAAVLSETELNWAYICTVCVCVYTHALRGYTVQSPSGTSYMLIQIPELFRPPYPKCHKIGLCR